MKKLAEPTKFYLKKFTSLLILVLSDIGVIYSCFFIAYFLRSKALPQIIGKFAIISPLPFSNFQKYFYMVIIWIIIFLYSKLYTKRFPFWDETLALIKTSSFAFGLIIIMIFVARAQQHFSRTVILIAWILSLILFPLSRYLTKMIIIKMGLWRKRLLIIGANETSLKVIQSIKQNPTLGYDIIGFLDSDPNKIGKKFCNHSVIGSLTHLEVISKQMKSKDIFISLPHINRKELKELLYRCEAISESMWLVPQTGDLITSGAEIESMGKVIAINIKKNLAKPWNILMKNVFDYLGASILIIFFSPVFIIIALAIKLDSKGPIIFRQERLGKNGKPFRILKFRTMYLDSDKILAEYFKKNPAAEKEWRIYRKLKGYDPRVTRIGRILRKYSLDELPQFLNVIAGQMSLVGPRPYIPEEIEHKEWFKKILGKVKPGITGLWQISGRNEIPFEERTIFDEYYIRNWSLWLDIIIILKSFKVFLSKRGAF